MTLWKPWKNLQDFKSLWSKLWICCLKGSKLFTALVFPQVVQPLYFSFLTRGTKLGQRFSTPVQQEFLKHAIPAYLARGTDLSSLRLSNKKLTTANIIAIRYEWIKTIPIFFCQIRKKKKNYIFLVCHRIFVISLSVPWDENRLKITVLDAIDNDIERHYYPHLTNEKTEVYKG